MIIIICALTIFCCPALIVGSDVEKEALRSLYDATNGDNWVWRSSSSQNPWNFTDIFSDPCADNWQGVFCDAGNITMLKLFRTNLVGTIPSDLTKIIGLRTLDLSDNSIYSTIPTSIGLLTSLRELNLNNNLLTGILPAELSSLLLIDHVLLYYNQLRGPLERSLVSNWVNLVALELNENFFSGTIASNAFMNCTQLSILDLYDNRFYGPLPVLPSTLLRITMHTNSFSGTIPVSYFTSALELIDLSESYLTGCLPNTLTSAANLWAIALGNNLLSCSLPPHLDAISMLQVLTSSNNFFTGTLPAELFEIISLSTFRFVNNYLTGTLPRVTDRDGINFDYFNAGSNFLTGSLPFNSTESFFMIPDNLLSGSIPQTFFSNFHSYIDASRNILSGAIPDTVSSALLLYNLLLSDNRFTGSIPTELFSLDTLTVLNFADNMISGTLPSMKALTSLTTLILVGNEIHGNLPELCEYGMKHLNIAYNYFTASLPQDFDGTKIEFLAANDNFFTGTLPNMYTAMRQVSYLDFSDNILSGEVYRSLASMSSLESFNINNNLLRGQLPVSYGGNIAALICSENYFTGSIPRELSQLNRLAVLSLQGNRISGSLDEIFNPNMIALRSIDLSDNDLTGTLPDDLFRLPNIQNIAMVKNCFRTKLPRSICESNSIRILALDGLAAGSECRNALWDPLSIFGDTYFIDHSQYTIPSCLFDMENLTTLHLSGNGLTGNIEHVKLKPSSKLTSLSLSYNRLSGTLPGSLKNGVLQFQEFDVSHNRFSGGYSDDDALNSEGDDFGGLWSYNVRLSLQVNRFSGDIPQWMNRFADVRVLSGNMFQCSKQSDLPSHDPDSDVYICGSGELDSALWVLLSACGTGIISALCFFNDRFWFSVCGGSRDCSKDRQSTLTVYEWIMNAPLSVLRQIATRNSIPLSNLLSEKYVVGIMRSSLQSVLTCKDEFVQEINLFCDTNIYLLGVCRLVLCIVLCAVLPCILLLKLLSDDSERTQSHQYRWLISAAYMSGTDSAVVLFVLWAILIAVCVNMIYRRHVYIRQSMLARNMQATFGNATFTIQNVIDYMVVIILNMIVVFIVNGAYIYIQLKDVSQSVQIFSQVSLAGFKLVWDTFVVGAAISWISSRRKDNLDDRTLLYTALLVFNNIIAPCFVTAVTDDTCFKGLFEEADAITVEYENTHCTSYAVDPTTLLPYCYEFSNRIFTTSYIPPFNYNYQCSSAILKSFVPVFIYAYAFMILALPVMDVMICSVSVDRVPQFIRRNLAGVMWPSVTPDLDKPLIRVDRVISTLMRHLAVLLTFGFAYPLLGVGVVIAMVQYVWKWRLLIVRYVATISIVSRAGSSDTVSGGDAPPVSHAAFREGAHVDALMRKLNSDCKGSWRGAYICLWAVIWPGALFMGCLLFDILGDEVGWKDAIWILMLTLLLPLVYWPFMKAIDYIYPLSLELINELDVTRNPIADGDCIHDDL